MRVFYAVSGSPTLNLPHSQVWHNNLYPPLPELGHEVVRLTYDIEPLLRHADPSVPGNAHFIEQHRPAFENELLRQIEMAHRQKPLDVFFSYFYSSCVTPEAIREIRSWGIVTINFFCNNVHQFHLVEGIAPAYDYCVVPERVALPKYQEAGANPIHIQMAANPDVYRPYPLPREYAVTFVGQRYADRPRIIDYLLQKGIDVHVWGPGWVPAPLAQGNSGAPKKAQAVFEKILQSGWKLPMKIVYRLALSPMERRLRRVSGPPLSDEEMIRLYSRSQISLGFSVVNEKVGVGEVNSHLRLRDFEAPMCGALYVTGYTDELADYFEPDKEVLVYRSKEELLDKVRYYLAHPVEAEQIRRAAHRRALAEHTWKHRFKELFAVIFG